MALPTPNKAPPASKRPEERVADSLDEIVNSLEEIVKKLSHIEDWLGELVRNPQRK
jgi:hypothetical protein